MRPALFALCFTSATVMAAPLGPGDRAIATTSLAALAADPFAEAPLAELVRVYHDGPGVAALTAELKKRSGAGEASYLAILLGRVELRLGHRSDGARALRRVIDAAPPPAPAMARRLAPMLDEAGDREGAVKAFSIGLSGASPVEMRGIRLRQGSLLLAAGKTAEARAAWDEAKRLAPADQALRRRIAEGLAAHHQFRDANAELAALEPLVTHEPAALVDLLRRESYFAESDGNRALAGERLFEAYAVAARAGDARLQDELARSLIARYPDRRRGELESAARARAAKDPILFGLVGDALAPTESRREQALEAYRRALTARPGDRYVLRKLCALERGADRIRDLDALARLDPSDVRLGEELVGLLLQAHRSDEALVVVRTLQVRFADDAAVLFELATVLSREHESGTALPIYERAVTLDGKRADYLAGLADCYRALGRGDAAQTAYGRTLPPSPTSADYRRLIKLLLDRGDPVSVRHFYEEALTRKSDDVALRRDFASWLARGGGSREDALREWQRVASDARDPFIKSQAEHAAAGLEHRIQFAPH